MTTGQTFTITDNNRQLETVASFNADEPLTLSATNASGSVVIRTDPTRPSGSALVAVRRTDDREFDDDDHALTVKSENNTISVHPDWQFAAGVSGLARRFRDQLQHGFRPDDWSLSRLKLSPELDFHIAITLPAALADGSQVKLRTASGEIFAGDITSQVSIVTASGDVDATNLTGIVAIHTASGDVHATNISESLEINTASGDATIRQGDFWLAARSASGDISVRDAGLRNSRITTVSGDINVQAAINNTANYGMETVSGDVSITAAIPGSGASARLGFGTLSGSSNVGPDWQKTGRREWRAGDGESGPTINVKTVSGDLSAAARLDPSETARSLEIPAAARAQDRDQEEDYEGADLRHEMKEFKRGMKGMHQGMQEGMRGMHTSPVPPTPPAPLTSAPPAPPTPAASDTGNHSHIFTAGPSGRPYRGDEPTGEPEEAPPAQPTEPVTPPQAFHEDAIPMNSSESRNEPQPTTPDAASNSGEPSVDAPNDAKNNRLDVLELLERGEIDIDEAMARLESEKDTPSS